MKSHPTISVRNIAIPRRSAPWGWGSRGLYQATNIVVNEEKSLSPKFAVERDQLKHAY
jgi:hypothetical protein